jgi:hypothetical protein
MSNGRTRHAIELFDAIALKGFLGHEMAHLVSDSAAQGPTITSFAISTHGSRCGYISGASASNAPRQGVLGAGTSTNKRPELGRKIPAQSAAISSIN